MLASEIAKGSSLTGETPSYSAPAAFGRFQVLHQVGAGVQGPVFLARDPERAKSIAIKVFRLDITPEQAAELVSHLAALTRANLAHPSVVVPFEAGLEGTVPFLAEDYVTAESLDAAIRQYGPPPLSQAIRILAAVAGALDFAGAVGIQHGALHPRDLLVTADETRVTGLGIARALETIGLRAPLRRPYVAPERVQREGWDGRADIYSLGVIARELLLGRSRSDAERPRLPEDQAERLHAVLAKATAARPADRYPSALELMSAIQDSLVGRPAAVPADSETAPTRIAPANRRAADLLPLEEPEPAATTDIAASLPTASQPGAQVPLAEAAVRPELGEAGTETPPVEALPDIELRHVETDDHAGQPLSLRGLDAETRPDAHAPTEAAIGAVPIAESTPAIESGPAFEAASEPPSTPARPVHHVSVPAALERATAVAPQPGRERTRSLAWPVVAVLLLVLGGAAGYLLGTSRRTTAPSPAPTAASPTAPGTTAPSTPTSTVPGQPGPAAQAPAPVPALPSARTQSTDRQAQPGSPGVSQASPTPPTARAAAKAQLIVRSTPRGATVLVNGRRRGVTPLSLRNLDPGRYKVSVSQRGYDTEEREVVLSAARPSSTLTVSLDRTQRPQTVARSEPGGRTAVARTDSASRNDFFGTLSVDSLPAGARVFLDGKLVGKTPLAPTRVPAGSHVVRVDMTGFLPWTTPIQITTGQRKALTASLERESR